MLYNKATRCIEQYLFIKEKKMEILKARTAILILILGVLGFIFVVQRVCNRAESYIAKLSIRERDCAKMEETMRHNSRTVTITEEDGEFVIRNLDGWITYTATNKMDAEAFVKNWDSYKTIAKFPDISALTNVTTLASTWYGCSSLTNFPNVAMLQYKKNGNRN